MNENTREKYILLIAYSGEEEEADASLDELAELLDTAGAEAVGRMKQKLAHPDPATYIGSGKAMELKISLTAREADGIVCDDELSPAQMKNLSELLDAKVIDRTMLILDIFAAHAHTSEGKLQVEMAQLKYRVSRLTGAGKAMSRLGGGIGTRGPGESKLETDRRVIGKRISRLGSEIKDMQRVRMTTRKKRMGNLRPVVAIVGYTNAGKSTLLNRLTDSEVLSEDKLFATLDPTTRTCVLKGGQEVLFTDTVGFINKLPHQLIDAFRSTLEEARYADVILHVADASDPALEMHMQVVYETLRELEISGKPIITAFNKVDLLEEDTRLWDDHADESIRISAKSGYRLEELLECIDVILQKNRRLVECTISYTEAKALAELRRYGELLEEEYAEDGIRIKAYIPDGVSIRGAVV
ncbi:MAG: GTPase HflX [Lachnospiraceae bacterium]|nr:GTPase HflX [Lachnospiraceae bacterium]